jgi:hypothetical protein
MHNFIITVSTSILSNQLFSMNQLFFIVASFLFSPLLLAKSKEQRDLRIPFNGTPGVFNAITDVKGVEVGYSTIISGSGKNIRGKGSKNRRNSHIAPWIHKSCV